jgi:hypothetical protein
LLTDAAPEGQGGLLGPGEQRRDGTVQQGKLSHDKRHNSGQGRRWLGFYATLSRLATRIFSTILVVLQRGRSRPLRRAKHSFPLDHSSRPVKMFGFLAYAMAFEFHSID